MLAFTGSSPEGFKAEIRTTDSLEYSNGEAGYSLFTWKDDGTGVYLWKEQHSLTWEGTLKFATQWINTKK